MCFEKNLWKFKQILKFLFEILSFKNCFKSFKENVNKNLEKLNENYNFLLLYILIAGWGLVVPHPLQIFQGFGGRGRFPSFPLATPLVSSNVALVYIHIPILASGGPSVRGALGICLPGWLCYVRGKIYIWRRLLALRRRVR